MAARQPRAARLGAAVGLLVVLAGCSGGPGAQADPTGAASPPPAASAVGSVVASAAPGGTAPAPDSPSAVPASPSPSSGGFPSPSAVPSLPDAPPEATIGGLDGGASARGALGSYTWGGSGTDAPWIVGRVAGDVRAGSALTVSLAAPAPASWTAAWAGVADGVAGAPTDGSTGGGVVTVTAPPGVGDWSLRVTASFGPGANATYYWRLTVTP